MNDQNTARINKLRDDSDTLAMMSRGLAIALEVLEPPLKHVSELHGFADEWADQGLPSTAPVEDRERERSGKEIRFALASLRVVEDLYHHLRALRDGREAQQAVLQSQIDSLIAAG